jgi:hypothetical protein
MADPLSVARSPTFAPKVRGGFALLIVLTLISFLVLLLVGLATYTRIETAVAGNTQRQAQARQNALLGLQVALGQLQRHAGPDTRVTATAEAFPNTTGTRHFTGVWSSDSSATATPTTPLTWLVSGNEIVKADGTIDSLVVTPAVVAKSTVELVGRNSSGVPGDVVVPLVEIASAGVPGQAFVAGKPAAAPIGRYGWWVGDQGVKAPVAVPDTSDRVTYAPYGDGTTQNELGKRLRQQIGLGAGAADANGNPVFEPRDTNNASLVADDKIIAPAQLAFLRNASNTALGLTTVQQNFHTWSPNNFAVLANTKLGGLRQDLSLKPDLLGPSFAAWADYASLMEDFIAAVPTGLQSILPAYGPTTAKVDPLRRRYKITPPQAPGVPGVAPVLTYFYIIVAVKKQNALADYSISLRWAAALWNPYSSSLVPEDLRLEVSGLPSSIMINARRSTDPQGSGAPAVSLQLAAKYGTMKLKLPWVADSVPTSEQASWLPGRVYNWVSTHDPSFTPNGTNIGDYASRNIPGYAKGMQTTLSSAGGVNGNSMLTLSMSETPTITVKLLRESDSQKLAEYTSPTYSAFLTTDEFQASGSNPTSATSPIGFIFRLKESFDTVTTNPSEWLTTSNYDPRNSELPSKALTTSPKSIDPTDCKNFTTIGIEDRLLDRDITRGTSYNEDVPIFELPRAPLLSLGELQHFPMNDMRPFAIGNSWGALGRLNMSPLNSIFDRFFLSGLTTGIEPNLALGQRLPNSLLTPLPRKADGTMVATADLTAMTDGSSSKFLLQSAAFSINSVSAPAWGAILRSVRFEAAKSFTYVNADGTTGTGPDSDPVAAMGANAQFLRFAHSAQEVYKADDDYEQSTTSTTTTGPIINTPLFRRGVRSLDTAQVAAFANAIAASIRVKQADSGPFRSVEEFLNPSPLLNDQSVIEKAIADAGLNSAIPEFSSQWLTQGDVMTALAPVLFPRSDTFVIRSYGEAVNPATGATEGRAWCEATVQRVPEYFDKTQPEETAPADLNPLNQRYGRRFKVISFRWLTRSDI